MFIYTERDICWVWDFSGPEMSCSMSCSMTQPWLKPPSQLSELPQELFPGGRAFADSETFAHADLHRAT